VLQGGAGGSLQSAAASAAPSDPYSSSSRPGDWTGDREAGAVAGVGGAGGTSSSAAVPVLQQIQVRSAGCVVVGASRFDMCAVGPRIYPTA
jgi:hypothetical protein